MRKEILGNMATKKQMIEEEIEQQLNEALSIANDVITVSNDLGNMLMSAIKETKVFIHVGKGTKKEGSFLYNHYGLNVNVKWERFNYTTKPLNIMNLQTQGSTSIKENTLFFRFVIYSGRLNRKEIFDTVQHEVSHYYEQLLWGKSYNTGKNYETASNILQTKNEEQIKLAIAVVIYAKCKYEHRAFTNGAYQFFMQSDDYYSGFAHIIKKSPIYQAIIQVRKAKNIILDYLKNYGSEKLNASLADYVGIDAEKIIDMANMAERGLLYGLGRAKTKALMDYRAKHDILVNDKSLLEITTRKIDLTKFLKNG